MDKIIGMGNALVDELVRIEDDAVLEQLHLPKGSMQLIDEQEQLLVRERLADKKWVRSVGGCAGNTVMALAHLGASVGFIGKTGEDMMRVRNMGKKSLDEVQKKLEMMGLSLASEDSGSNN